MKTRALNKKYMSHRSVAIKKEQMQDARKSENQNTKKITHYY